MNMTENERWEWAHKRVLHLAVNPVTLNLLRNLVTDRPEVADLDRIHLAQAFATVLMEDHTDEWLYENYPELTRSLGPDVHGGLFPLDYRMSLMGDVLIALFPVSPRIVPGSPEAESFNQ